MICGASSSSSDRTARRNEQFSSRFNLIIESVVDRIEVDDHFRCSKIRTEIKRCIPSIPQLEGIFGAVSKPAKSQSTEELLLHGDSIDFRASSVSDSFRQDVAP